MRSTLVLVLLLAVGCASHQPDIVGPEPRPHHESRWIAPDVRYLVMAGEPMFVVDGHMWMARQGRWLRWHGDGWRWASPPTALERLPSHLDP